jgi:hypothetical protein
MKTIKYLLFLFIIVGFYYLLGPYKTINSNKEKSSTNIILFHPFQEALYLQRLKLFNSDNLFETLYTLPFYQKTTDAINTSQKAFLIRQNKKPDFILANKVIIKETYYDLSPQELQFINNYNFNQNLTDLQTINIYCFYWKTKSQNKSISTFLEKNKNFNSYCNQIDSNNFFKKTENHDFSYYYTKLITSPFLFSIIVNFILLTFVLIFKNKKSLCYNLLFCLIVYDLLFILNSFF